MSLTADARQLFTRRPDVYARFIRAVRYPQGLRAFWRASPLLRPGLRILEAGCGTGALTFALWDAAKERGIRLDAFDAIRPYAGDARPAARIAATSRHRGHPARRGERAPPRRPP